ncbi:MAG: dihydroorotate dehydrogenase [Bacillota bacterium]|nr:dihydroorotate dehydrogenase [Bacillota bacterium]
MIAPDLKVNLGGISLENPLLAASGPLGYGHEFHEIYGLTSFGGIIVKGISVEPWTGNPPPRIAETYEGMLNSVGLQNPGVRSFLKEDLPRLLKYGTRIIVNIIGRTVEDYSSVASDLDGITGIDGLEVNISCPNLKAGGLSFGTDPRLTFQVVDAVRRQTKLPLLVKLTPNVTDINVIARAAEEAGADGLSLINTLGGMLIDTKRKKPVLGNIFGGLSGPAIMPVALKMVWQVAGAVKIPILGMGGISSTDAALQFMMAGARAVALGSCLFKDPLLPRKIIDGILKYMEDNSISSVHDIVGTARKGEFNI